jgi:GntR family transcriptional repressor for pyruvate dehydrogenase complex
MSGAPDVSASPPELFRPVSSNRISATIVEQIRGLIRSGDLPPGARLPAERDLCDQLGVSRLTLREALRMLEANGLLEIRVGVHGGAFVTAPTAGHVGEGITDLLSMSGLSAADVTQAREVLELGIVPLVCENATEQDFADLLTLCDEAEAGREQDSYTVAMSLNFHLRVAAATHNPALMMLMQSFQDAILMSLQEARHEGTQGVDEHRAFVAAVRDRDATRAQQIMASHLLRTADAVSGH